MSTMQWLSDTSANKVIKTYVDGYLDCSGYLLNRVGNVMIGNVDYPGYNINQRSLLVNGQTELNGNLRVNGNISVNSSNIALGLNAAAGTVGTNTVAIGTQAGQTNLGSASVAIGYLTSATRLGNESTAVGSGAGYNQTGSLNTFIGREAGFMGAIQMTGARNTYIGYNTSANGTAYGNSTAIGTGAIIRASNQVVLGTTNETVVIPGKLQLGNTGLVRGILCGTSPGTDPAGNGTISFGLTFAAIPVVAGNMNTTAQTTNVFSLVFHSITTTQFSYTKTFNSAGTNANAVSGFGWIAICL